MKSINLFICSIFVYLFIFNVSIYSQSYSTDKGSKIISGSFSFSSAGGDIYENSHEERLTTVELNADFGFFTSPGFEVGGKVLFSNISQGGASYSQIGLGPQLGYFWGDGEKKLHPFVNASFLYVSRSNSITGSQLYFGGGICFMISDAIGLAGEVGYQVESLSSHSHSITGDRINLSIGIKAFLF